MQAFTPSACKTHRTRVALQLFGRPLLSPNLSVWHTQRLECRHGFSDEQLRTADEAECVCRIVEHRFEVGTSNPPALTRPRSVLITRDCLMELENSSGGMSPKLVDEGELFAAPRAVEKRYPRRAQLPEHVIEHRSKRCDSRSARDQQDSFVRYRRCEREGPEWPFNIDDGTRSPRSEVRTQTSVLLDRNEQIEKPGFPGLIG